MREIKFRAWDRKEKCLFPVHELEWHKISNSLTRCVGYDDWDKDGYTMRGGGIMTYANGERYVLMQYTGLKDINGKEIYEGDIFLLGKAIRHIEYDRGSFTMFVGDRRSSPISDYNSEGKYKVIGNIYENPELLNKE